MSIAKKKKEKVFLNVGLDIFVVIVDNVIYYKIDKISNKCWV